MLLRLLLPLMLVSIIWAMSIDDTDEDIEDDSLSNLLERERRGSYEAGRERRGSSNARRERKRLSKEERRDLIRSRRKCFRSYLRKFGKGSTIPAGEGGKRQRIFKASGGEMEAKIDYDYLRETCRLGKRKVSLDGSTITYEQKKRMFIISY
uniref:Major acrosomal protein n=1 Tax=Tegula aureotincta TaxID=80344 RepID=Q9NIV3_9VEST|nr:major acrosomal protein precursor [Tegula aureotincta]